MEEETSITQKTHVQNLNCMLLKLESKKQLSQGSNKPLPFVSLFPADKFGKVSKQ